VGDSVRDRRRHPDKNDLAETLDPEWNGMRIDTSTNRISISGVEVHRHEVIGYGDIDRPPVPKVA
jgi:hypothetical protein